MAQTDDRGIHTKAGLAIWSGIKLQPFCHLESAWGGVGGGVGLGWGGGTERQSGGA